MKVIEYTNYEINDLIRMLEYAKAKKKEDYKMKKINLSQSTYEIGIIEDLISKIPSKTFLKKTEIGKDSIEKENILNIL